MFSPFQTLGKAYSQPEEVLRHKDLELNTGDLEHGLRVQQCFLRHLLVCVPRGAEPGYYLSIPNIWLITDMFLILVELENELITLQNEGKDGDPEAGLLAQYFSGKVFRIFSQITLF